MISPELKRYNAFFAAEGPAGVGACTIETTKGADMAETEDGIVIASAVRTPSGKFGGQLSSLSAAEMGIVVAREAITRAGVGAGDVDQSIFGIVLQANSGQNVARQIALGAGMTRSSTAMTVNQVCGSGLKAVRLAQSAIVMGDADVVLAGGAESMSNVPFYLPASRFGHKYGNMPCVDGLHRDGLADAFSHKAMGITAENVARRFHVTREEQDAFAFASHRKAMAARDSGAFEDEMVPVVLSSRRGVLRLARDETIRDDTSLEKLAKLRTAFLTDGTGTVTAGNASGISDAAAALVLMSAETARRRGVEPLARITGYAEAGIDPEIMGYAPKLAVEKLSRRTGTPLEDVDLFEINEAFAAQSVAVVRDLGLPMNKINVNGGAIALGHPLGASGARVLTTLVHALERRDLRVGVATLCVGGGMAVAMQVER